MTERIRFANNAVAVVNHALAEGDGVITLAPGDGNMFPTVPPEGYFKLTLEDRRIKPVLREIAHCIGRTGDTLTLLRAQEGTTAKAFVPGFTCSNRMTAATMNVLVAAAIGLGDLWLGVHIIPPTVGNDGGPIPIGALYFNSATKQTYAWDGVAWRSQFQAGPALAQRLFYYATDGQTQFGDELDIYGMTLNLNTIDLQPVLVYVNGELLFFDDGSGTKGEYTVDHTNNCINLLAPVAENDQVELQQLVPKHQLAPSATDVKGLRDIDLDPVTSAPGYIDGVHTTFKLIDMTGAAVVPANAFSLQIYLDGVQQRPLTDYNVSGDNLVFPAPPPDNTSFWGNFFGLGEGLIGRIPSPSEDGQILTSVMGAAIWVKPFDEGTY